MKTKIKWKTSKYPGVRFWEHPARKHGVGPDKYFTIRYYIDGKRREEGLGWASGGWTEKKAAAERGTLIKAQTLGDGPRTLAERREIADQQRAEKQQAEKQAKRDAITFRDFFENIYIKTAETNKQPVNIAKEKGHFKNWINPVIGRLPVKDIRPLHIEKIKKNMMDANRAPRTIEYCFATIRQIWNAARLTGLVNTDSPTKSVKTSSVNNKRQGYFTHEDAEKLLTEIRKRSEQLYQITLLSLHCGLRASEIFNLTWNDIYIDKGLIMLWDTKGNKSGFAYMTDEIKKMFLSMPVGEKNELIFKNEKGQRITEISKTFKRVVDKCGFNDGVTDRRQRLVFHSCRHTYASWLVESGVDLYTVQKLLRHSNFQMTERYAHLGENTLQNAVKRLESNIPKKTKRKSKVRKLKR